MTLQQPPYSKGERAILLMGRLLTVTLLTSVAGAIGNCFYERFFAPDLYAAGPPVARAVWLAAITIPFLVGLFLFGLPATYLLHRFRTENAASYALAGCVLGALYGYVIGFRTQDGAVVFGLYGATCALFWWWQRPKG